MFYTSYFAKIKKLPSNIKCVSIARYTPQWYNGATCMSLAPSPTLLAKWKAGHNEQYYAPDPYNYFQQHRGMRANIPILDEIIDED